MKRIVIAVPALALTILPLTSCDDSHAARLEKFAATANRTTPTDGHQWLEMENFFGEWEKVVLVFGYVDNLAACEELAMLAHTGTIANRSGARYRCISGT